MTGFGLLVAICVSQTGSDFLSSRLPASSACAGRSPMSSGGIARGATRCCRRSTSPAQSRFSSSCLCIGPPQRGQASSSSSASRCTSPGSQRARQRFLDHRRSRGRQSIVGQAPGVGPADFCRIRAESRLPASNAAHVIDDNVVIFDAPVAGALHALDNVDDRSHFDAQTGLLPHFPDEGRFERFPELHAAAWQAPLTLEGSVPTLHEQHAITVNDHRANANNRRSRKSPQVLDLMTTFREAARRRRSGRARP